MHSSLSLSSQVLTFNGEPVINLRHLAQMVWACKSEFMRLDLVGGMCLMLSSAQAHADTKLVREEAGRGLGGEAGRDGGRNRF